MPELVVLAAGLGSRFGGAKQLAPVGPHGEAILDYTLHDARRAGFDRVVLVVRSEIEGAVAEHLAAFDPGLPVAFVCQDRFPAPARAKPWGTAQAVLAAGPELHDRFGALNADDLYGRSALEALASGLGATADHVLVGYRLADTVPARGAVTRAPCEVDADGRLQAIYEVTGIEKLPDGSLAGAVGPLPDDLVVSMNLWGFQPSLLPVLADQWSQFLHEHGDDPTAELLLPAAVGDMVRSGKGVVRVLPGGVGWIGLTNRADVDLVRREVARLIESDAYPDDLRRAAS